MEWLISQFIIYSNYNYVMWNEIDLQGVTWSDRKGYFQVKCKEWLETNRHIAKGQTDYPGWGPSVSKGPEGAGTSSTERINRRHKGERGGRHKSTWKSRRKPGRPWRGFASSSETPRKDHKLKSDRLRSTLTVIALAAGQQSDCPDTKCMLLQ